MSEGVLAEEDAEEGVENGLRECREREKESLGRATIVRTHVRFAGIRRCGLGGGLHF